MSDYGTELDNGSFTGFAGILQRGEVDIVATDLTVTLQVLKLLIQAGATKGTKLCHKIDFFSFSNLGSISHFGFSHFFWPFGSCLETAK